MARRRIVAWLWDWLHILVVPLAMVPVALGVAWAGWELSPTGWNVAGFFLMVVPVTVWLALREAGPLAATPGKRRRGLAVVGARSGAPISLGRALARNTVKVAIPWQLGHSVAFGFATLPADASPGAGLIVTSVVCYALMGTIVAGLFVGDGRTIHDRIAGTTVVSRQVSGREPDVR